MQMHWSLSMYWQRLNVDLAVVLGVIPRYQAFETNVYSQKYSAA